MRSRTPTSRLPTSSSGGAREGSTLLAVGALRDLGDGHFEVKSMHTSEAARRQGLGRAMLEHLVALAEERGTA